MKYLIVLMLMTSGCAMSLRQAIHPPRAEAVHLADGEYFVSYRGGADDTQADAYLGWNQSAARLCGGDFYVIEERLSDRGHAYVSGTIRCPEGSK